MAKADISVIIPSKNNANEVAAIIDRMSSDILGVNMEFIVIDINSANGGIIDVLNMIKEKNLSGYVIQSGGGTVSSALNTGIYKASGRYITFVYPSRLYKNYISDYFSLAEEKNADFIFAAPETNDGSRILISDGVTGADVAVCLIRSSITMDFTAVMFKREFLVENKVSFYEDCRLGYAEEFVFNTLLHSPIVAFSKIKPERDHSNETVRENTLSAGNNCFERLEAMIRVFSAAKEYKKDDRVLLEALEFQKLPSVTMSCIDKLLAEGFGASSIKKLMKNKGYDKYLDFSRYTSKTLRNKILLWKTVPWLYKP